MEAPHKIHIRLIKRFKGRRCFKIMDICMYINSPGAGAFKTFSKKKIFCQFGHLMQVFPMKCLYISPHHSNGYSPVFQGADSCTCRVHWPEDPENISVPGHFVSRTIRSLVITVPNHLRTGSFSSQVILSLDILFPGHFGCGSFRSLVILTQGPLNLVSFPSEVPGSF